MPKQKQYIEIVYAGKSPSGKTEIWHVLTMDGYMLGNIRWLGRWRQYAFHTSRKIILSPGCMDTIGEKINELMEGRKGEKASID